MEGVNPFNVIVPVCELHVRGLVELLLLITGTAFTVTAIAALLLSQPLLFFWLTYQVVVPAAVVDGLGATTSATPPADVVYQSNVFPAVKDALKATEESPTQ